jgi:hypothetical protein
MVSEAGKTLKLLKSSEVHRLAFLFRNAHAIGKQNRPLTDYKWLCQVEKSKGLDIDIFLVAIKNFHILLFSQ